jgi:hypothetical protein
MRQDRSSVNSGDNKPVNLREEKSEIVALCGWTVRDFVWSDAPYAANRTRKLGTCTRIDAMGSPFARRKYHRAPASNTDEDFMLSSSDRRAQ